RPGAEVDLRDQLWPDVADLARLVGAEPVGEGTGRAANRLEALKETLRHGGAEADSDPADVPQGAPLVDAERKRADRFGRGGRNREAADHEFLSRGAFALEPAPAASGPIGGIAVLRDHPLQAEAAGVTQHDCSALLKMAAEAQRARVLPQNRLKRFLAADE